MRYADVEPPRVRALIGSIAEELRKRGLNVNNTIMQKLKDTLNPLTFYKLGTTITTSLKFAKSWNII